jgi:hypothetical protein
MRCSIVHKVITLCCTIFVICNQTDAQTLQNWGIKVGLNNAVPSAINYGGPNQLQSRLGIDVGVFGEWFNHSWLSLNSEINFIQKKSQFDIPVTTEMFPDGTGEIYSEKVSLNNLSFLVAGKARSTISNYEFYGLIGPRITLLLSKSAAVDGNEPIRTYTLNGLQSNLQYYKAAQFGITMGAGIKTKELLPLSIGAEVRYSPDFTKTMESPFNSIRTQTWEFLIVLTF